MKQNLLQLLKFKLFSFCFLPFSLSYLRNLFLCFLVLQESTLKSLLSALWNLSAHSIDNKVAICSVDGALGFLVSTLTYRCQTNSLAIIESGGGILRNVSSLVATREDYRCAHETQRFHPHLTFPDNNYFHPCS